MKPSKSSPPRKTTPPFDTEAVAYEQDTLLLMGKDQIDYPRESVGQLFSRMYETPPQEPGTVLVRGKNPFRLLAIVHDINEIPTWHEEWIAAAFEKIFRESEKRKLRAIGVPLLGTLHGTLDKQRCFDLLMLAMDEAVPEHLRKLWLILHLPFVPGGSL